MSPIPPLDAIRTTPLLLSGAFGGALTVLAARLWPRHARAILAGVLLVGAAAYLGFAAGARTSTSWLLVEVLGLGAYGTLGLLGVRGSPWWLVAGWAAHPLWDIALHVFGAGSAFAPVGWTVPCLSWDLLVAGALAVALRRPRPWVLAAGHTQRL